MERRENSKMTFLLQLLFPPPPSIFVKAMSLINFVASSNAGFMEVRGRHMQYSKFWNANHSSKNGKEIKISSRTGMLILYTPAFLAALASFSYVDNTSSRALLLSTALAIHFLKRVLEVLFVHQYSGAIILGDTMTISLSYFLCSVTMIYAQKLTQGLPDPPLDLQYPGILLFLVGIFGNFYHHHLLSKLRSKDDKGYKIPRGGLFSLVICPHYLFEIIGFVGICFISPTIYSFSFTLGTTFYLMGRSYATRKWYLSKFSNFPREVKALVPYVF